MYDQVRKHPILEAERDLKKGIIEAAVRHGSDGNGTDGLIGYLGLLAAKYPRLFTGLLTRLLPLQVSQDVKHNVIGAVTLLSVPHDRYLTPEEAASLTRPAPPIPELELRSAVLSSGDGKPN